MRPFQAFFETHRAAVWRFCVASVGRGDADDVFQDTFLAALRGYDRRRAAASGQAWIMTIAHHKAMDHHRAARRRPVPAAELPDVPHHDVLPDGEDPVWRRVRALPPKQRAAVTLRSVGGLSHAEVARVLGCTEEAARRSAHEGLKRLRQELPA